MHTIRHVGVVIVKKIVLFSVVVIFIFAVVSLLLVAMPVGGSLNCVCMEGQAISGRHGLNCEGVHLLESILWVSL